MWVRIVLALVVTAIASLASPAMAQVVTSHEVTDLVVPQGKTTYLDLARHFVPDIALVGGRHVGKSAIAVRHIGGKDYDGAIIEDPGLSRVDVLPLDGILTNRLLLFFDFNAPGGGGEGLTVLALYDISGEPRLLDAVNISFDKMTSLEEKPMLKLGKEAALLLSRSSHFNAGQAYDIRLLTLVTRDKLALIDTALLFSELYCNLDSKQDLTVKTGKKDSTAMMPIRLTVTEIAKPGEESCEDGPPRTYGTKKIKVTYRWDRKAGRYVPNSKALDDLAKQNAERF